jgi:RNA polymerase sigma factor (TIGR02999 family)
MTREGNGPERQVEAEQQRSSVVSLDELTVQLYKELRQVAARLLKDERPGHTLVPTAVVHEAYVRLAGSDLRIGSRTEFLALAAQVMRRVLVDHARRRNRQRRGGGAAPVTLDACSAVSQANLDSLLEVDEALRELASFDQRKARLVELLYFGGLTYEEAAETLRVSVVTVHRDLRLAKAWLKHYFEAGGHDSGALAAD